ncbi:DNA helicase [Priestia megaterium]|uniref:UvrD-helicase domain-containing protein n=3 Tax=Priestia megaterium TaxID=1404 RepID=UPI000BF6670F|nr:ATP-dependent helicase [Priestia megaterium]PFP06734.1 DNA helicase [Priestia megaterium]PFU67758.1 DNA helicase [Priestia megaterium]
MNELILPDKWRPTKNIELELNASKAVKSTQNTVVTAGPGAGKTELLAQKAGYLLQTGLSKSPQKILAISFKVDAAKNLAERVEKRYGLSVSRRFQSTTFDSFAKQIMDQFRTAIPLPYRPKRDYRIALYPRDIGDIARTYIKDNEHEFPNWEYQFDNSVLFNTLTKDALPIIEQEGNMYNWLTRNMWSIMPQGRLDLQSTLTFPMISRLAEYLLRTNPYIVRALRFTYSHVLLDEFQDTTNIQYELLKTAFLGSNTILTAVGDEKQRIMGWAGALEDSFTAFTRDFCADHKQLMTNYRSAPKLVSIQNILARAIREDSAEIVVPEKWDESEGICEVWVFDNHKKEARYLADKILEWLINEGLNPREICILVKQQESIYAKTLMDILTNRNIQTRIEKNYQELLADNFVKLFIKIFTISTSSQNPEIWLSTIKLLSEIRGVLEEDKVTFEQSFKDFVRKWRRDLNGISRGEGMSENLQKVLYDFLEFVGEEDFKAYFPFYRGTSYLEYIISELTSKLAEAYEKTNDWNLAVRDLLGESSIPIMTIHKSKGLEYDTVIFLGLEDDAFWSFQDQTETDMCAFFVALSRAKKRIIFTVSKEREVRNYGQLSVKKQSISNIVQLYHLLQKANVPIEEK